MRGMIAFGLFVVTLAGCRPAQTPSEECRRQNGWRRVGRSSNPDPRLDAIEDIRCDEMEREERREAREDAHRAAQARTSVRLSPPSSEPPATPASPTPGATPEVVNLAGLWVGDYGPDRVETIRIEHDGPSIIATKVTGDSNVPAGKPTFRATMVGREGDGAVHVADEGYENPRWVSGHVSIVSKDVVEFRTPRGRSVRLRRVATPEGAQ